jgi:surface polysaccharide O-acyltransferase-like enzyme
MLRTPAALEWRELYLRKLPRQDQRGGTEREIPRSCTGGDAQGSITRNVTLDLARVFAIFFVMFIHSPAKAEIISTPGVFFLKGFISCGAVPIFFMLSGFFGRSKIDSKTVTATHFIQDRARTLLLPFLLWNGAVILLVLFAKHMTFFSRLREGGTYFDVEPTVSSISCALLGIGRLPIVYQFWFLRDLMVVVMVAFFLCRCVPRIPLLPWLCFAIPLPMASSLGYYLLGYQLRSLLPPEKFPTFRSSALYCTCWLMIGVGVMAGIISIPNPLKEIGSASFIFMMAIMASTTSFAARLSTLGFAIFFVYAAHEPLQSFFAREWSLLHIPA